MSQLKQGLSIPIELFKGVPLPMVAIAPGVFLQGEKAGKKEGKG
jgi:hypothetical protein